MSENTGPRRAPRRRRVLFVAIACLLVMAVVEGAAAVVWWRWTGECFSWAGATAARASALGEIAADGPAEQSAMQRVANAGTVVHPYLGYVDNAELGEIGGFRISSYGFVDDAPPLHRRAPERFVVGLVGGSFALQLGLYAQQTLIDELHKSPLLADRQIEVVRLGLGGFKQPQQLLAVQLAWLLGGEFDCLINLDGFNEVALVGENVPHGVPGWFPRGWRRLLDSVPTPDQQRRLGHLVVLREQRRERAVAAGSGWWSPTLQCLWWSRDRALARRIAELAVEVEHAASAPSFAVTGPGTEGRDVVAAREQSVALWRRASLLLDACCRQQGTHYFHFLQPNQYVPGSKPLGAEEARVAIDMDNPYATAVVGGYPMLRRAGLDLQAAGVAFTDLTQLLVDHAEPLYVDACCHLGRRGYEIVAAHIAARVRQQLDLLDFAPTRLMVRPAVLRLTSPLASTPFAVLAVDGAGREVDVTGAGFGTRITADPAEGVAVAADGSLRATRRGSCRLHVHFAGLTATGDVAAEWPDDLVAADGKPAAPGQQAPSLWCLPGEGPVLTIGCAGLPPEGFRLLAASLEPLPVTLRPGQDAYGVATLLLGGDGDTATALAPMQAAPGRPLFLRVYVVAADSAALLAVSNSLVATRGNAR